MFNHKIVEKYEEYCEAFERRQDELCDYEMQPMDYDEFEAGYLEWREDKGGK